MKCINIITLQNVRNYGSALQAYATKVVFESLGVTPKFYDFKREDMRSRSTLAKSIIKNQGLKGCVKSFLWIPSWIKEDKIFPEFIDKHLDIIKGVVSESQDFTKIDCPADIYCTGSDQTWNSGWNNGILGPMFLDFAPEGAKCISYAASFGKSELDEWEKEKTKKLLSKYSFISVRESSAVKICNDLGYEAYHVLDPTLQLSGNEWRKLARKNPKDHYCLLYQLNTNKDFDQFALDFCKERGLKLLRFCNRYDKRLRPADEYALIPKVEDFIAYIDCADFVLTDSFHCTAFSINLNKQFLSFYPAEYGGRIQSILTLTKLEDRHIVDLKKPSFYSKLPEINYGNVNIILNEERVKGLAFLRNALK